MTVAHHSGITPVLIVILAGGLGGVLSLFFPGSGWGKSEFSIFSTLHRLLLSITLAMMAYCFFFDLFGPGLLKAALGAITALLSGVFSKTITQKLYSLAETLFFTGDNKL